MGTLERQKKPYVTLSFNRLLPASVLSRQRSRVWAAIVSPLVLTFRTWYRLFFPSYRSINETDCVGRRRFEQAAASEARLVESLRLNYLIQ